MIPVLVKRVSRLELFLNLVNARWLKIGRLSSLDLCRQTFNLLPLLPLGLDLIGFFHWFAKGRSSIPESAFLLKILFHTFQTLHDVFPCFVLGARWDYFCECSAVHHLALQIIPTFVIAARFWCVRRIGSFLVHGYVRIQETAHLTLLIFDFLLLVGHSQWLVRVGLRRLKSILRSGNRSLGARANLWLDDRSLCRLNKIFQRL